MPTGYTAFIEDGDITTKDDKNKRTIQKSS